MFSNYFLVFLSSCFPEGSIVRWPFVFLHHLFLVCDQSIQIFSFLFLNLHLLGPLLSLLDTVFGHHILKMYLRHRLTKVWILRRILLATSHVSHPYKSTDFTQALKILISVSFRIDVDSHTFLNLENDHLAFWILTLTSVLQQMHISILKLVYIHNKLLHVSASHVAILVLIIVLRHTDWSDT
jgi:hypothetical protein